MPCEREYCPACGDGQRLTSCLDHFLWLALPSPRDRRTSRQATTRDLETVHHHLAGVQLDLERLLDRVDARGDLYATLAAVAGRLHALGASLLDIRTALAVAPR
jgi:hypothetical protein